MDWVALAWPLVPLLPVLALLWPILAIQLRNRRAWRPWGFGGCLVLGIVLTTGTTWGAGDMSNASGVLVLLPLPFYLLGVLNLVVAADVLVVFDRERSARTRLAVLVIFVGTAAGATGAGVVLAKLPRLPDPAPPQQGQVTGVVGEPTLYGWRRLEPHRRFDVVAAVPVRSFRLFRAMDVSKVHEGPPKPPVHDVQVPRDNLLDLDGVRLVLVHGEAFTLDGLDADVPYWICVGNATEGNRWSFVTCDRPDFEIPGQVRIAHGHPSVGGAVVAPLR